MFMFCATSFGAKLTLVEKVLFWNDEKVFFSYEAETNPTQTHPVCVCVSPRVLPPENILPHPAQKRPSRACCPWPACCALPPRSPRRRAPVPRSSGGPDPRATPPHPRTWWRQQGARSTSTHVSTATRAPWTARGTAAVRPGTTRVSAWEPAAPRRTPTSTVTPLCPPRCTHPRGMPPTPRPSAIRPLKVWRLYYCFLGGGR